MLKHEIMDRLEDVIDSELANIYDTLDIKTGNIAPDQNLCWDESIEKMAELFIDLINDNNHENLSMPQMFERLKMESEKLKWTHIKQPSNKKMLN